MMVWNFQMIDDEADYYELISSPRGELWTFLPIAFWYQSHQEEHNAVKHWVEQSISYIENKQSKISLYSEHSEHLSPWPSSLSLWLIWGSFLLYPSCAMIERPHSSPVVFAGCHMRHRLQAKTKEHFLSAGGFGSVGWTLSHATRVTGSIPIQGTGPGCGLHPQKGACRRQLINFSFSHGCFSLSFPLPSPSLKWIKTLKKTHQKNLSWAWNRGKYSHTRW